jgi:hypothetical protein
MLERGSNSSSNDVNLVSISSSPYDSSSDGVSIWFSNHSKAIHFNSSSSVPSE